MAAFSPNIRPSKARRHVTITVLLFGAIKPKTDHTFQMPALFDNDRMLSYWGIILANGVVNRFLVILRSISYIVVY